jgi:hypothetical protein
MAKLPSGNLSYLKKGVSYGRINTSRISGHGPEAGKNI